MTIILIQGTKKMTEEGLPETGKEGKLFKRARSLKNDRDKVFNREIEGKKVWGEAKVRWRKGTIEKQVSRWINGIFLPVWRENTTG